MPNLLLSYPGSKAILARWHATLFPRTQRFVSVFAGAAAEFMYRQPTGSEVLNDLDGDIHNMFKVIRSRSGCAALKRLLPDTPDGREQFGDCKKLLDAPSPIRRAWAVLMIGNTGDIRSSVRQRNWSSVRHRLYWLHEHLSWWCDRLRRVKLECLPWQDIVECYDGDNTLLYCDPPYYPDTLTANANLYRHVLTAEEHIELLMRLRHCRSRVMVCGYPHPVYDKLLSGWVQLQMTTTCRMGDGGPRTEALWLNYDPPGGGRIHA